MAGPTKTGVTPSNAGRLFGGAQVGRLGAALEPREGATRLAKTAAPFGLHPLYLLPHLVSAPYTTRHIDTCFKLESFPVADEQ